jgi:hypothetical protein
MPNYRCYYFHDFPSVQLFFECFKALGEYNKVSAHVVWDDGTEDFWDADSLIDLYNALRAIMHSDKQFRIRVETVDPESDQDSEL